MSKRILFFINTLQGGGAERVLIDTVNNMDHSKFQITVQTLLDGGKFQHQLHPSIRYKGIIKTKNPFLRKVFSYILSFVMPPRIVYNLFMKDDYDYEVAYLEGVPTRILSGSSNKNARKYAWVHTDVSNNYEIGKVFSKKEDHIRCYKNYDKIICVSASAKEGFASKIAKLDSLCVKYNVIDDIAIKEKGNAPYDRNDDGLVVVSVGRFEQVKGFDRLLRIHNRLIQENFLYKLLLVGDGTLRQELEDYVKENNLSQHTEFLGFQENPYPYIKNADIVAIPSRVEGYGMVACEALMFGKPIVMTDCSSAKEILGNSEFGIVTDNNEEDLYNGLKAMIEDSDLRKEYATKAGIRSEVFTRKSTISNIQQLFE